MKMDRRDFLRLAAAAGCSVAAPLLPRPAHASDTPYEGPFWVTLHAGGGWDPTLLCDPKGRVNELEPDPINRFGIDEIATVGPFSVAPVGDNVAFFERYRNDLLVINGIDAQTNSHETGRMTVWSGGAQDTLPAFAALVAGVKDRRAPASFLSYGGHTATAGLVPATRLPDVRAIAEIAHPSRLDALDPDSMLFSDATRARIAEANLQRLERVADRATLPRSQRAANMLFDAQAGDNALRRLAERLPTDVDNGNNLASQAAVACASFAAGVCVAASLQVGGFDTHGNHDERHIPALQRLLAGVDAVVAEAERQGIADKVYIVIGSEFGRTPGYNEGNGKDHWSITSMMLMGPGIRGGRVIGATDARQRPLNVDPTTLALSDAGTRIRPSHIHAALRELAGVSAAPASMQHPVADGALPLFS